MVDSFKDLKVWQKGISLVVSIYEVTEKFPKREVYSLTDQIRRAAVSIPSNIAEGFGRNSRPEMSRYILIAIGSLNELETQLIIAEKLAILSKPDFDRISEDIRELNTMLRSFHFSLRKTKNTVNNT